jgi:hypothetical protein
MRAIAWSAKKQKLAKDILMAIYIEKARSRLEGNMSDMSA